MTSTKMILTGFGGFALAMTAIGAAAQVSKTAAPQGGTVSASAFLSPVPMYPPNGVIPEELAGNYLFLDGKTHDLVISYPSAGGVRAELRTEMKNHVSPFVYVSFSRGADLKVVYHYTILNTVTGQPRATRDIASWSVDVPVPGSNLPVQSVDAAFVAKQIPVLESPAGWQSAMSVPERALTTVSWTQTGTNGIVPGGSLTGASIGSPLLPGFVHMNFAGSTLDAGVDSSLLPPAVVKALDDLNATGFNRVTVLTVGPKFPAGTNRLTIAANYLEGISVLTKHGYLSSDSPFIKEVTTALTSFLGGAQYAADGPAADYAGPALDLQQKPATGLESQIREALLMSLGAK